MVKQLIGIWDIQEMEDWDKNDLHMVGIPFIKITTHGSGRFQFSSYGGVFDGRVKGKGDTKQLVFKWKGGDGDHEESGIGWIHLKDKDTIAGELTFEYIPDTKFIAKRRKEIAQ